MTELATLKVTENGYPVLLVHFKYILSHYMGTVIESVHIITNEGSTNLLEVVMV